MICLPSILNEWEWLWVVHASRRDYWKGSMGSIPLLTQLGDCGLCLEIPQAVYPLRTNGLVFLYASRRSHVVACHSLAH